MGELIFIGLGLYDEKDISVKGKELVKSADYVFCEFYTSQLAGADLETIKKELGIDIRMLSREEVESKAIPLEAASKGRTVFLTAGDPMAATTHVDLRLRAQDRGLSTRLVHSSSIFSAAPSALGVQHYKFGKTVTMPFPRESYPRSPYDNITTNKRNGFHSLVLLDIDGAGNRYMTVNEGIEVLLELEENHNKKTITGDTVLAGLARVGSNNPSLKAGYPEYILEHDFGGGLQCMVVFGDLHFMEIESLMKIADAPEEICMIDSTHDKF